MKKKGIELFSIKLNEQTAGISEDTNRNLVNKYVQ
jgi:hypothetical protein